MQEDILIEIGCEELPPKILPTLATAFHDYIENALNEAQLSFDNIQLFAAPRRIALVINQLANEQPTQKIERRGPAVKAAFDSEGNPTKAASGFAKSCGVEFAALEREQTNKGEWLMYRGEKHGSLSKQLLPDMISKALKSLPIPKPMRWGNSDIEFIRPIHWVVLMQGSELIPATIYGCETGKQSVGHRFHHPKAVYFNHASEYESALENAQVIADFSKRRDIIKQQVGKIAQAKQATAVLSDALLDEVTAIVEWPVALLGHFDQEFLEVPSEALIASMADHQKCFHCVDANNELLPYFITVANINSNDQARVIHGNERVIRARLSDADFFYRQDLKNNFTDNIEKLKNVAYQAKLGSLYDKTERVTKLSNQIAELINADGAVATRAALLSRCDLMSDMVGEFPELQGIMGHYYALKAGESTHIAQAMLDFYRPGFSGDQLPQTLEGCALALAERIDTLVGIFSINQQPTGMKDPFKCRRAAQGIVRIIIEKKLSLSLDNLLDAAIAQLQNNENTQCKSEVNAFIIERLRAWYLDKGFKADTINAVLVRNTDDLMDLDKRMHAIAQFRNNASASALAAANKRVSKILQKENVNVDSLNIDEKLLSESSEKVLAQSLQAKQDELAPLLEAADYKQALQVLSELRQPVDTFFDDVMVMVDDEALRNNRLALLANLRQLFLHIADISLLQVK